MASISHWGSVYRNTNLLQIHFPKVKPPHTAIPKAMYISTTFYISTRFPLISLTGKSFQNFPWSVESCAMLKFNHLLSHLRPGWSLRTMRLCLHPDRPHQRELALPVEGVRVEVVVQEVVEHLVLNRSELSHLLPAINRKNNQGH